MSLPWEGERWKGAMPRGLAWAYFSGFSAHGLRLLGFVLLAHLLKPEDFGLMAMAMAVIVFLGPFKDLGVGEALIQDREGVDQTGTVLFWLQLGVGVLLVVLAWLAAPLVAGYFHRTDVVWVLRALALVFVIYPFSDVVLTILTRELQFKALFLRQSVPALAWGIVALGMALGGFGVWSLVGGMLAGAATTALLTWHLVEWRPSWRVSRATLRRVLGFGSHISLQNLFSWAVSWFDMVFVGHFLGAAPLGLYRVGRTFGEMPWSVIAHPFNVVAYPVFCRAELEGTSVRQQYLSSLRWLCFVIIPAGIALVFLAPTLVPFVLGKQWTPAIPILQLVTLVAVGSSVIDLTTQVFKAVNRPSLTTKLFFVHVVIAVPAYYYTARKGLIAVALALGVLNLVIAVLDLVICGRVLAIPARTLLGTLKRGMAAGLIFTGMGLAWQWGSPFLGLHGTIQGAVLLAAYAVAAALTLRFVLLLGNRTDEQA